MRRGNGKHKNNMKKATPHIEIIFLYLAHSSVTINYALIVYSYYHEII